MRVYRIYNPSNPNAMWCVKSGAMMVWDYTLTDRRQARRAVRMARRLGYSVIFSEVKQ